MNKLYGLVEAGGFCFEAFGVSVGVRSNLGLAVPLIRERLPRGSRFRTPGPVGRIYSFFYSLPKASSRARHYHLLYADDQILVRSGKEEDLLDGFDKDLGCYFSQTSTTRFFVHAGVAGWKGAAIVIPGPSFSGKTTLVQEFLSHGAAYYSDEFAVLDGSGGVHPFAKPLGVRKGGSGEQVSQSVSSLGCPIGTERLPIGLILLTRYKRGARWRPQSLSTANGVLGLFSNAISGRENPARSLSVLCRAANGARVLNGVRGEANLVARRVLKEI